MLLTPKETYDVVIEPFIVLIAISIIGPAALIGICVALFILL
jgi:hypothetical protein